MDNFDIQNQEDCSLWFLWGGGGAAVSIRGNGVLDWKYVLAGRCSPDVNYTDVNVSASKLLCPTDF